MLLSRLDGFALFLLVTNSHFDAVLFGTVTTPSSDMEDPVTVAGGFHWHPGEVPLFFREPAEVAARREELEADRRHVSSGSAIFGRSRNLNASVATAASPVPVALDDDCQSDGAPSTTESDAAALAAVGGDSCVAPTLSKKFLHELAAMHHQSEMIDFRLRMRDYITATKAKLQDAEADEKEAHALATGGSFRRARPPAPPEDPLAKKMRLIAERKAAIDARLAPVEPRQSALVATEAEVDAATKLQALQRGRVARKSVASLRDV